MLKAAVRVKLSLLRANLQHLFQSCLRRSPKTLYSTRLFSSISIQNSSWSLQQSPHESRHSHTAPLSACLDTARDEQVQNNFRAEALMCCRYLHFASLPLFLTTTSQNKVKSDPSLGASLHFPAWRTPGGSVGEVLNSC